MIPCIDRNMIWVVHDASSSSLQHISCFTIRTASVGFMLIKKVGMSLACDSTAAQKYC